MGSCMKYYLCYDSLNLFLLSKEFHKVRRIKCLKLQFRVKLAVGVLMKVNVYINGECVANKQTETVTSLLKDLIWLESRRSKEPSF